jgi:hypothetical protein
METLVADSNLSPNDYVMTPAAGRRLKLSGRTLEKHRTYGTGPRYRKIGGRVVYKVCELDAWADQGAQTSTTDANAGRVRPARAARDTGAVYAQA